MEQRLLNARTLTVTFEASPGKDPVQGTFLLGEGQKASVSWGTGGNLFFRMVSDGQDVVGSLPLYDEEPKPAPKNLRDALLIRFSRVGVMTLFPHRPDPAKDPKAIPIDGKTHLVLSEFVLAGTEIVDNRSTVKLRYRVYAEGTPAGYQMTLWIDLKTDLPVKRHYIATQKWSPDGISLSRDEGEEVYRSLILDSKIEDKEFSLKRR
jgi:hypothetical protein